jgi:hypothetical protein
VPAVRFSRDKRGYEYVYLVHTPMKRGKAGRSRVLYWYRTPPGVRIGRKPFDEDVQRALERQNPGVSFDWEAIIGTPMPPPDMTEFWRERRKAERAAKQERRAEEATEQPDSPAPEPAAAGHSEPTAPGVSEPSLAPRSLEGESPAVAAVAPVAPAGATDEGVVGEPTVRKKRRRRGGRRRKGPGGGALPQAAPGGEAAASQNGHPPDEVPDDPSDELDSTSEGE